jgi:predicted phosphodiesterase
MPSPAKSKLRRAVCAASSETALLQAQRENARLREQLAATRREAVLLAESLERHNVARRVPKLLPAPPSLRFGGEFVRVIIPDSHGSAIDPAAAAAFLGDLRTLAPREIVMLGDHVDCGGFLAQHHTLGYVAQTDYSYEEDIAAANGFLDAIQTAAPKVAKIHYIEGNHERRVETWCVTETLRNSKDAQMLRRALVPEYLLRLKDRGITYYRQSEHYHGVRVPGAIRLGKCFFWHGVSTARHAAAVNVSQFAGNVVYGHTHRMDSSPTRPVAVGEISAWNPGCLCKLQPLWQHTRPTNWTHGYALQLVSTSGQFLHINIPIIEGKSLLGPLLLATRPVQANTETDKPTVPQVLAMVRSYAAIEGNDTGGSLHVVLDDGNVDDSTVRSCIHDARQRGDQPGVKLGEALLQMSRTQRLKIARQFYKS